VAEGDVGPERLVSFEPPWRRVARLDVAPFGFVEHTVAIRDDGAECHLIWAAVGEVPPAAADDPALAAQVDTALARLQAAVTVWADRCVSAS
jgi:hypothetical protein